jgi:acetyl-CoA carboxylase biotin carboxyl carrier protein
MKLTDEDVREILRLIDESPLEELRIETEDFALYVRRGSGNADSETPQRPRGVSEPAPPRPGAVAENPAPVAQPEAEQAAQGRPSTDQPTKEGATEADADGAVTIASPMLGTFYRAQEPGAKPLVEVGADVEADTIVCIIEVMKMMNSIPAGVTGTIVAVCAENAEVVEHGEPLFRVQAPA